MNHPFLQRMKEEVLVMSGAMSTMLAGEGANLGGCVSQWIADHPETYRDLVENYYRVGCHIVSAATSSLNRITLAKFGLTEKMEELNHKVIAIIKAVKPPGRFISANIGPTGRILKPLGDMDPEEVLEAYGDQARAIATGGAEIIYILTMFDLEEAVLALRAAKSRTNLPVIASLAFNPAAKGYRTVMGVSPEEAAKRLESEGADVIGANCGSLSLDEETDVLRSLKAHCDRPLIAKPNAGAPEMKDGRETYAASPESFAAHAEDWVRAGARIVSGCCGSTPLHIAGIAKKVREIRLP